MWQKSSHTCLLSFPVPEDTQDRGLIMSLVLFGWNAVRYRREQGWVRAAVTLGSLSAGCELHILCSVSWMQKQTGARTTCHWLLCSPGDPKIQSRYVIKSGNSERVLQLSQLVQCSMKVNGICFIPIPLSWRISPLNWNMELLKFMKNSCFD